MMMRLRVRVRVSVLLHHHHHHHQHQQQQFRAFKTTAAIESEPAEVKLLSKNRQASTMNAWIANEFGAKMNKTQIAIPDVSSTSEILIRVKASSVNPIDTVMLNGYGRRLLSLWKQIENRSSNPMPTLPFIGGRDCSGIVEYVGYNVSKFRRGDQVMAVIGPTYSGAHAEYVIAKESWCTHKPSNIAHVEAASLPYVACTAWAALVTAGQITPRNAYAQNVLIHGGSGGVGTTAIQLLKAWNVGKIVATCSPKSFEMVSSLGAIPINYKDDKAKEQLTAEGPFDLILDCVDSELAKWSEKLMGIWRHSVHVSLISPTLKDTDKYGIPFGLISTARKYLSRSAELACDGRWFSYAYFAPNEECLSLVAKLLENGKMKAIVEETYRFDDLPKAYEKVAQRHGKGKTVIDFEMK